MKSCARRLPAAFLCVVVLVLVAPRVSPAGDSAARLYTNADLERFPVLPDSSVTVETPSVDEWDRVVEYLNREHARIDADRAHELQRNQSEAEVELIRREANRRRYYLPVSPWNYRNGHGPRGRETRYAKGRHLAGGSLVTGGAIRPLHAGPTRSQIDYHKAQHRSGADAFPIRSRPGGTPAPRPSKPRSNGH